MFPGGGLFQAAPIFIAVVFVIVLGLIIFRMINGARQWNANNHQPVLTVPAVIVSKRTKVSRHNHNNGGNMSHTTSTSYFVTFEVESGDRMELHVHGRDYGLLAENDKGQLTFQGTRFKGFKRANQVTL